MLSKYVANNGIEVVYGGGKVGLIDSVADSVLAHGGKVHGVIPEHGMLKCFDKPFRIKVNRWSK